jgi:Flp pilus assembly pilin Flp
VLAPGLLVPTTRDFENPAPGEARATTGLNSPKEDRIMGHLIKKLVRDESAQGMAEYALLAAFIALIVLIATKLVGTAANAQMNNIASQLAS